jgi:uncharacterized protein (TIGR02145 family)
MKIKTILIALISLLSLSIWIFQSCKKDDEKTNQPPTCKITAPPNGQEIQKGETVVISVEATDPDGTIAEVRFFVDGIGKGSVTNFPFNYNWNTSNESLGSHILKAKSIDNIGASASDEITVSLITSGTVPVANFTATPTSGTAPLTVNFTDQSANSPTSWQWNFGDGGTSTQQNPSHTYNKGGTYSVSLIVTNEYGSDVKPRTNYIVVSGGGDNPIADFTATPTNGSAPLTVNFTDQSANKPASWQWDFGDGETSTQQNPTHTYNNGGTYSVTLTVTNEYGSDVKTRTNYIVVSGGSGDTFTDPRDGQTYNIVTIGSQTLFAENLNYETSNSWWYNNSSANGDVYGRIYTWGAALTACPDGWHLPNDDEWKTLEMHLGMSQSEADDTELRGTDEGGKLKEAGTAHWSSPNTGATNSSGFTALPGGGRYGLGSFSGLGYNGVWWSATETSGARAWSRGLGYNNSRVYRSVTYEAYGCSVRCLKD